MNVNDFESLVQKAHELFEKNELPETITPLDASLVPAEILRFTIYKLHIKLKGKGKKHLPYVQFLKRLFPNKFEEWTDDTLKKKLSVKPSGWEYWSNSGG